MRGVPVKLAAVVNIVEEMYFQKIIKESLTKKDFISMAKYMKSASPQCKDDLLQFAINISKADNPRFDEDRFRKAALGDHPERHPGDSAMGESIDTDNSPMGKLDR